MRRVQLVWGVGFGACVFTARAQAQDAWVRVPVQVVGGFVGGTVSGLFGAAGGQALGELLPGGTARWTFAGAAILHNVGTTWTAATVSRLFEGRRANYSDTRKGVFVGDAAFVVYGIVISPLLARAHCGVGSVCGKTFGVAAHLLPSIAASVAIERTRSR